MNEWHGRQYWSLAQLTGLLWSYEVGAGRRGCCIYLLYRSPTPTCRPDQALTFTDNCAAIIHYLRANLGAGPRQVADGASIAYELAKKTLPRMAADARR